jgi:DNA polymerase-1
MSKARNLIAAFNNNQDIHAQTAGLILNKPITLIDSDERRMAKAINFGLLYGMGPRKLAKDNNITLDQAKEFIDVYFKKFPQIRDFFDYQIRVARSKGYAETIMGRRLYLPNLRSAHPMLKSESERVAINMPIQGSAADIIKMAMIRLEKSFTQLNSEYDYPLVRMIIQVHDELVFEVHKNALDRVKEIVDREMRYALPERYRIIIPLTVDIGVGKNWLEAH